MSRAAELGRLTWMRLLLFVREPEAVFWVFLFPIMLALVLSIAFKDRGPAEARIGVVEGALDATRADVLAAAEGIRVMPFPTVEEAEKSLRSGAIDALVSGGDPVVVRSDPGRPEGEIARLRADAALQQAAGRRDPVRVVGEPVTERGSRYIDFLIPGLIGMNLMGTGVWGTGFPIVEMRQKKLLKRFLVTPMRKSSFLFAQILSRFIFLVLEVAAIAAFGVLLLGVPFRGHLVDFAVLCVVGAVCFSALGLLVGSRAQTMEGASGLMNFVMMPMWLFSGVFFSYEKFPDVFHPVIRLLPLTAAIDALRALMLEGDGLVSLLPAVLIQAGWTALILVVALRVFRWR